MHTELSFKSCNKSQRVVNFIEEQAESLVNRINDQAPAIQVSIEKLNESNFETKLTLVTPKTLSCSVSTNEESIYGSIAKAFKKSKQILNKNLEKQMRSTTSKPFQRQIRDSQLDKMSEPENYSIDASNVIKFSEAMKKLQPSKASFKILFSKKHFLRTLKEYMERLEFIEYNPQMMRSLKEITELASLLREEQLFEAFAADGWAWEKLRMEKGLENHMREFSKSGLFHPLEAIRKSTPTDYQELVSIPRIATKRVKELYKRLGVNNRIELLKAAQDKKIRNLDGFGEKLESYLIDYLEGNIENHPIDSKNRPICINGHSQALLH